jgi:hypothetical protein
MFRTRDEPGLAKEAIPYHGEPEPASQLRGFAPQSSGVSGIDISALPPRTEVVVETCNSRYSFVILDGASGEALVEGGRYFPQETTARIEGSILGGSPLEIGWIGLGLFLVLSIDGKRIVTSRVRSITIDGDPLADHPVAVDGNAGYLCF